MKLYVFNPDADMALGNNKEHYMAPAPIRRMAEDLALLPIWYAQPGSGVLAPSAYNAEFLKQMRQLFRLDVQLVTEPELPDYADVQVMPWGWNPAIRKRLLDGGILERRLPTKEYLQQYRMLASRINSMLLFFQLDSYELDYTCGVPPILCDGSKESDDMMHKLFKYYSAGFVVKSLWSGSGRGLRWCRHKVDEPLLKWCNSLMEEDGAFLLQPIYEKAEDFAMEFYSDGKGKVIFMGYSRFMTSRKGSYLGNYLISDRQMEEWMQFYLPLEALAKIRNSLLEVLSEMVGDKYTGYLGVDMMACRQDVEPRYAIYPCVEMNLRMNMGLVSHAIYDNFIAAGSEGEFSIDSFKNHEELLARHEQDMRNYPLHVEGGRIVSGYMPLVPITPKSRYRAFVCVTAG